MPKQGGSWRPTGSASFRKLAQGLYEVRYRPFGARGPYLKRRVPGSEAEVRELLARQSVNRSRQRVGLSGFLGWVPGVAIRTEWFDALLKERCRIADVAEFSAHDLRHAASTWARAAGMSPWFVKELLGHSQLNTTMLYAHESADLSGAKVVL